jgi:phage gp29-like protein
MIFSEIFGMPIRIARYQPTATPEEKRELLNMLESLGSNAAAVFSQAIDLQVLDTKRIGGDAPYEKLIDFLNREMSKAWLGQTLTTDIVGQSGSVSASRVHERVRQDVLTDDLRKEARTIRRDLLAPLTTFQFGPEAPVPFFRRKLSRLGEPSELVAVLDVAINQLGLGVSDAWVREALGIPRPAVGEPTLHRASA